MSSLGVVQGKRPLIIIMIMFHSCIGKRSLGRKPSRICQAKGKKTTTNIPRASICKF